MDVSTGERVVVNLKRRSNMRAWGQGAAVGKTVAQRPLIKQAANTKYSISHQLHRAAKLPSQAPAADAGVERVEARAAGCGQMAIALLPHPNYPSQACTSKIAAAST